MKAGKKMGGYHGIVENFGRFNEKLTQESQIHLGLPKFCL